MHNESSQSIGQQFDDGTMFAPGHNQTPNTLIASSEVSHAKTSATQEREPDCKASEAASSMKSAVLFAKWDQDSLSWKTSQRCLLEGWAMFSGRWPRSGTMRNGIAYRLPPLVRRISGTACSYWVTPTAVEGRRGNKPGRAHDTGYPLAQQVMPHRWPTPRAQDGKHAGVTKTPTVIRRVANGQANLAEAVLVEVSGGSLNPNWVEWLMGFPPGWTDLED